MAVPTFAQIDAGLKKTFADPKWEERRLFGIKNDLTPGGDYWGKWFVSGLGTVLAGNGWAAAASGKWKPSDDDNQHEGWQYMGSVPCVDGNVGQQFRHRCHPNGDERIVFTVCRHKGGGFYRGEWDMDA